MSRNLLSRLQAAESAPPPPPAPAPEPTRLPVDRKGDPDAWIKALLICMCVAMVLLVGWRIAEALEPPSHRLGTDMLTLNNDGDGPLTFSAAQGGYLQEVGNVVGLSARGTDFFVARSGSNSITVYRTKSRLGKTIVYDKAHRVLTYVGAPEKMFSALTGKSLGAGMDDDLLVVPSTLTGDLVQING